MRYLALLPVQRLTDGLSSMDNPLGTGSAGGARAEGVVEMEMDTSVDCADPHFLTHTEPRGPLPGPCALLSYASSRRWGWWSDYTSQRTEPVLLEPSSWRDRIPLLAHSLCLTRGTHG